MEVNMSGLLIRDLSDRLRQKLKERAKQHHRSMAKETLAILEVALEEPEPPEILPEPLKLKFPLTQEFLDEVIKEGRA